MGEIPEKCRYSDTIAKITTTTAMTLSLVRGRTGLPRSRSPIAYTTIAGANKIVVIMTPCKPVDHTRKSV